MPLVVATTRGHPLDTKQHIQPTEMKQNETKEASAQYKGFTLTLSQGKRGPVILIINQSLTPRADGVLEVVANPTLAKKAVDRRVRKGEGEMSLKDSERILDEGVGADLAAAMMSK